MVLTDLLKGAGRVVQAAALGLAVYGCGGSEEKQGCKTDYDCKNDRVCVNGYCEDSHTTGNGNTNNGKCGNSPVFGKYLWEISECSLSLHMREDCKVGVASEINLNYDYNCFDPDKEECNFPATYFNLDISWQGYVLKLDPTVRFSGTNGCYPELLPKVNTKLDQYSGYILVAPELELNTICVDDNAFLVVDIPFSGVSACRNSMYYAGDQ